ncbi:MAG: nitrogen regulation protein NR(II) [Pseudomonadales bacterium]
MKAERFSAQLLESLNASIIVLDDELDVLFLNHAAESLLECSNKRAVGCPLAGLFLPGLQKFEDLADDIVCESPFTQRSIKMVLASGKEITVDLAATHLEPGAANKRTTDRARYLLEMQGLDRILRISREETLLASQTTSRSLIRGLAHEIKNPLGGLRGAAQLLAKELSDPSLTDYTQVIIEEADRLRNLVDKMLGPNKLSERVAINVHEVLERVAKLLLAENHHRVEIIRDYDPSIPDIFADFEQLIQAVLNIMRNAKQALATLGPEHDSKITLKTRIVRQFTIGRLRHKLVVRVDIIDNGPGIDQELLHSVFYPMVSGRPDGTGLGLSISQSILHQHQGLIESVSKPGNTCFSLYIPLEPVNDEYEHPH